MKNQKEKKNWQKNGKTEGQTDRDCTDRDCTHQMVVVKEKSVQIKALDPYPDLCVKSNEFYDLRKSFFMLW